MMHGFALHHANNNVDSVECVYLDIFFYLSTRRLSIVRKQHGHRVKTKVYFGDNDA